MTPEQFCYWLQGRAELVANTPTDQEWEQIRNHLGAVFNKVTPTVTPTQLKPSIFQDIFQHPKGPVC